MSLGHNNSFKPTYQDFESGLLKQIVLQLKYKFNYYQEPYYLKSIKNSKSYTN